MRRKKVSLLSAVAFAAAVEGLARLVGFLLEVPSAPFGFPEGGKVLAGWILLLLLSVLAIDRLQTLLQRWRTPPPPPGGVRSLFAGGYRVGKRARRKGPGRFVPIKRGIGNGVAGPIYRSLDKAFGKRFVRGCGQQWIPHVA